MNARSIARAAVLLAASVLSGCGEAKFREVRQTETPHVAGSGLKVSAVNGFVRVEADSAPADGAAAPSTVRIEAEIRATTAERLKGVRIEATREASGTLSIRPEFPDGTREASEGCSFTIRLPDAHGVVIETSNGDVHVGRLEGEANLHTSNGAISAIDHRGKVTARTSNAVVKASGVAGPLDVETSNARIEIVLPPAGSGPVDIRTSNGEIRLEVPPGFAGRLDAGTSNADVDVQGVAGARVERPSRGSARIEVGQGGPASRLRTSNARILVASTEK